MATRLAIDGCSDSGISTWAESVDLSSVTIMNSDKAINVSGGDRIRLEAFSLADNGYGLFLVGDSSSRAWAHLSNGDVRDSRYRGIHTKSDAVLIDNVAFTGNGHGWPDPRPAYPENSPETAPSMYGGLVMRYSTIDIDRTSDMVVRNSTFLGNEPYGLASFEVRGGTDAVMNCWGDPTGPRVRPMLAGGESGPGQGDTVNEFVRFFPFLPCE